MKILLATADRDLLNGYKNLLEFDGHKVSTAFDGVQTLKALSESRPDIAIIENNIPRVDTGRILEYSAESRVPSVVLKKDGVTVKTLLQKPLACSYLAFPFFPEELIKTITDVTNNAASGEKIVLGSVEIDISEFRMTTGIPLTSEEINIIVGISRGDVVSAEKAGIYVEAINLKLQKADADKKITYVVNEGYKVVDAK